MAVRACLVCGEDAGAGLRCSSGHSTCTNCINSLCADPETIKVSGTLRCPWRGAIGAGRAQLCASAPWSLRELSPALQREKY